MSRAAIVIGAGPAGLSAALGLLASGHGVTILEQQPEWKGRVCGSFVNPDGVRSLRWMGLFEKAVETAAPVAVAHLHGPWGASTELFMQQDGTVGMAIQRKDLEMILRDGIAERGGSILTGARATTWTRDDQGWRVSWKKDGADHDGSADVLVVADGRFTMAGDDAKPDPGWYGFNAAFTGIDRPAGTLSLHFAARGYVGALTHADGTTNVCGLIHRKKGETAAWDAVCDGIRKNNRSFDRLLANAKREGDWHGVGPLPYTKVPRRLSGAILAGDAAGVGDPFMGEGIGRALGTGPLIHRAAASGSSSLPDAYTALWESCYGDRFRLGWKTRLLLDRPALALLFVDLLLRPGLVERATAVFHRGAGFVPDGDGRAPSTIAP